MKKVDFASQLRRAIVESDLSCTKIAERTGVTNASLSYFVNGKRKLSLDAASKVAELLGFELIQKKQKRKAR